MYYKIYLNIIYLFKSLRSVFLKKRTSNLISCIIFSKDRPLQLHATLESYLANSTDPAQVTVLYCFSNESFRNGYVDLIKLYAAYDILFIEESHFRRDLINILESLNSIFVFFLVDDIIFKSKFSFKSFISISKNNKYILSLRLGRTINYCYTKAENQELPFFYNVGNDFLSWNISKSKLDWAYAFSVDGHVYNLNMIREMAKLVKFKGPNSFESSLNIFKYFFYNYKGLCFLEPKLVNISLNRVQSEIKNRAGNFSTEELNKKWLENYKIDIHKFINISYGSTHIEVDNIPFIKR